MKKQQRAPYQKEDKKIRKHIRFSSGVLKLLTQESKKTNMSLNYTIETIIIKHFNNKQYGN